MSECKVTQLTPSLVAGWRKELHPQLIGALRSRVEATTAQAIRTALEEQRLAPNWMFGKRWFSKKRGAIFLLRQPK